MKTTEEIIAEIEQEVNKTTGLSSGNYSSTNGTLIWQLTWNCLHNPESVNFEHLMFKANGYLNDLISLKNIHQDSPNYLDILEGQELVTRRLIERIIYPKVMVARAHKEVTDFLLDAGDGSNEK